MKVLIACEFSGIVRDCFRNRGYFSHDAWSCDLIPCEGDNTYHIQDDVLKHLNKGWDLMIAHPPCTHLAVSGARWFKDKKKEQKEAIDFFMALVNAPIPRIAIENPIGIMSSKYRKPDQIIQPWQFGHGETKATCLWLKNLPELNPTKIVDGRVGRVWKEPPSKDRWKNRSRTYQGIAEAMATQWGRYGVSDSCGLADTTRSSASRESEPHATPDKIYRVCRKCGERILKLNGKFQPGCWYCLLKKAKFKKKVIKNCDDYTIFTPKLKEDIQK